MSLRRKLSRTIGANWKTIIDNPDPAGLLKYRTRSPYHLPASPRFFFSNIWIFKTYLIKTWSHATSSNSFASAGWNLPQEDYFTVPARNEQATIWLVEIDNSKSTRPVVFSKEEHRFISRAPAGNQRYPPKLSFLTVTWRRTSKFLLSNTVGPMRNWCTPSNHYANRASKVNCQLSIASSRWPVTAKFTSF